MDNQPVQGYDFQDVVETLTSMFANVISKEVIVTVVESVNGDLTVAADAITNMASYNATEISNPVVDMNKSEPPSSQVQQPSQSFGQPPFQSVAQPPFQSVAQPPFQSVAQPPFQSVAQPPLRMVAQPPSQSFVQSPPNSFAQPVMSYAGASRTTGPLPKQLPKPRPPPSTAMIWTDQLRKIVTYHNQGSRILILMRGVPGSGKTYLAKQIVEMTIGVTYADLTTHIYSTDDYFMVRGHYHYNRFKLSEAHDWNQNRVRLALRKGLSPVVVDNTNIEIWEMEPYVREGIRNGYIIEVVEPNTPWAKKPYQLLRKCTHNVPAATIKRMLDNYQDGITGEFLKHKYGLSYPANKVPPVLRTVPEYIPPQITQQSTSSVVVSMEMPTTEAQVINEKNIEIQTPDSAQQGSEPTCEEINSEICSDEEEMAKQQRYLEIQKQLEEIEKVEQEWENGESWNDDPRETASNSNDNDSFNLPEPRTPRRTNSEGSTPRDNSMVETVPKSDNWRQISMFMPPWCDESFTQSNQTIEIPAREMKSSGTQVEIDDTDVAYPKKVLKIITATSRDINLFYIDLGKEKIPQTRMLDKSTIVNELLLTEAYRCRNPESHFIAFRKLFKNIPRAALRDIFDKCCGDVNWAVDIVLGGMADKQLEIEDKEEVSDTEEEMKDPCNCLAAYNVIPDAEAVLATSTASSTTSIVRNISIVSEPAASQKKAKIAPSDSTMQLKRDIERNFVISDDHYSDHVLKIKKYRHGEYLHINSELNVSTSVPGNNSKDSSPEPSPSTSKDMFTDISQITKDTETCQSDDESVVSSLDDAERTININVGAEFISQLDDLFGRRGMTYPANVVPRINIPVSLLNEINAFWLESLMCQLDEQDKQNAKMIKEDAEFARQLALKEEELAKQGKEPEVPDFKEIMDMDLALALYHKNVAEWRSKEPSDMASRMTRDKLYNLFPNMSTEILSELLMAHDNNFKATVEVLLVSTGNANILQEKNGLNKFIVAKEMERQEKLLEEEKKALSEVGWPLLPVGEKVDLDVVNSYREEADQHLARRNLHYRKAEEYIRRGMTQVANYYSDIASFHKQKYEQANSLAAASLMQIHASKCPDNATIDLHYLRVGEAKESLDLFLDSHIMKLKESPHKNVKYHTLFFITGRGLHSNGRPKVKPAVKKRLKERGIVCSERNPGLLTAKVCADDKLSYQVKIP